MSRVVVIVCAVVGLAVMAPGDSGCPESADPIELAQVDVALPVPLVPATPRPAVDRWAEQPGDTGREPGASIFRPPV